MENAQACSKGIDKSQDKKQVKETHSSFDPMIMSHYWTHITAIYLEEPQSLFRILGDYKSLCPHIIPMKPGEKNKKTKHCEDLYYVEPHWQQIQNKSIQKMNSNHLDLKFYFSPKIQRITILLCKKSFNILHFDYVKFSGKNIYKYI